MKKTKLLFFFLLFFSIAYSQSPTDIQTYIDQYKSLALEQERLYGIPAPITLAQGILESEAGQSELTRNTNNHFGIKALGSWSGDIFLAWDDEATKSKFRVYASAEESFEDHSKLIKDNSRYLSLFNYSVYDYRSWANGLQKAGYATAPNYAKALIGYIDAYQLYTINGGVKLRPGKKKVITKTITVEELIEDDEAIDASEPSEEEEQILFVSQKAVEMINGVKCTILYPGETLASIAMKYNIPIYKILKFNETTDESDLHEGDIIFLEKKKRKYHGTQDYYRVQTGETLFSIAQQFGIRTASLAKMNHKNLFSELKEGEKLRLN